VIKRLNEFFPIEESYDPILKRWKNVIKRLEEKGVIPLSNNSSRPSFCEYPKTNYNYRDFTSTVQAWIDEADPGAN
jgi:hypothetical protein